jgi:hypothetical protein
MAQSMSRLIAFATSSGSMPLTSPVGEMTISKGIA